MYMIHQSYCKRRPFKERKKGRKRKASRKNEGARVAQAIWRKRRTDEPQLPDVRVEFYCSSSTSVV